MLLLVFPHRPTAPVGLTDAGHLLGDGVVLGVGGLALVAGEVPGGPRRDEAGLGGGERPPPVGVGGRVDRAERHGPQRHGDDAEADHRAHGRRPDGDGLQRLGDVAREQQRQEAADLGDADGRQEVHGQVVEGQQTGVPQPQLGHHHEQDGEGAGGEPPEHAAPTSPDQRQDQAGGGHDDHVAELGAVDELGIELVAVEQVVGVPLDLLPAHVVHVLVLEVEGHRPPRREQTTDGQHREPHLDPLPTRGDQAQHHDGAQRAPQVVGVARPGQGQERHDGAQRRHREDQPPLEPPRRVQRQGDGGAHDGEDERDEVAQAGEREQHGRPATEPSGAQAAQEHAEVEHRERERDGEGELAGQRRRDVAAVDGEGPIEEEDGGADGEERRAGEGQVGELAEGPGGDGQRQHAADGHQLEGDAVGDHQAEQGDQQRRDHHVELVGGEAVVPVGRPAGEATLGQQVVAQEGRTPHVGPHVATGRGVVGEEVARTELDEREDHAHAHHHQRHQHRQVAVRRHGGEVVPRPGDAAPLARCGRVAADRPGIGDRLVGRDVDRHGGHRAGGGRNGGVGHRGLVRSRRAGRRSLGTRRSTGMASPGTTHLLTRAVPAGRTGGTGVAQAIGGLTNRCRPRGRPRR